MLFDKEYIKHLIPVNQLQSEHRVQMFEQSQIKELFKSQSSMLNRRMRALYDQSIEVASISFALSKQSGLLNPDHILLAGLLHQIGAIPVLSYIEETGLVITDESELDNIIKRLKGAVGGLVIEYWGLSDDLRSVKLMK